MLISIVFLLILSPLSSLQGTLSEKKNDTTKSMDHTISHNVPKPVTTTTKVKNQAHAASSKSSSANQTLPSTPKPVVDGLQKPVPSLQDTLSEKKNSTTKSRANIINLNVQKPVTTNTKMKNQTQSTSSKASSISQTLTSTTKPAVDGVQKPGPALQGKLDEKKNSTAKSTSHTSSLNVPKLETMALKTKMKNRTHPTSSFTSSVNQMDQNPSTGKIVVDESSFGEKKNLTLSTDQTINVNVSKTVTTVLNTKTKNQTQSTSSKISQPQDIVQKHVPSLQDPLSVKKNSTVKSTSQSTKVVTLSKTKMSSTSNKGNQTLPSLKKPDVDNIQKPVQSVQSTVNTIKTNVRKPVSTLLKTKMKDQTPSTSSTASRVNQTLSTPSKHNVDTVQKPVQSVQNTISEKKNVTKSTINTIDLNPQKPITTLLKTKMKNLPSSSRPAIDVVQKPVSSLPATTGSKKNTTGKSVSHTINVNASKPVFTKMKNQTHSASSKPSSINETLISTPKSAVDVQKPALQSILNKKKNSTSKSQTISHNVPKLTTLLQNTRPTSSKIHSVNQTLQSTTKLVVDDSTDSKKKHPVKSVSQTINVNSSRPITTSLNTKTKNQTQSTSSKINNVNQTTAMLVVDGVQNPTKDKPAESSPVKVVITEACVQQESQTDTGNITKVRETELSLNPGSPLVMTHRINLLHGACTGGCETQMAALRDRVEFLEKEMSVIKKMCKLIMVLT